MQPVSDAIAIPHTNFSLSTEDAIHLKLELPGIKAKDATFFLNEKGQLW
ncbi:MAG: hypothetical protein PUP92_17620 [Rhizonema sp. PD38]|nr:hypothetical protein [Rhizonema sp. PD38]